LDDFKPFLGHFLGRFWMSIYGDQFSGQLVLHDAQSRAANAGGEHIRGRKRKGLKSEEKGSPQFVRWTQIVDDALRKTFPDRWLN